MSISIGSIRSGLDTRLATISGLNHSARGPDAINVYPLAFVLPGDDIQTGLVMTGVGLQGHFHVVVLAGVAGGVDSAQSTIDAYLSPAGTSSIKVAIEGDKTLGGKCDTLWVDSISDYDVVEYNDNKYMGAIIKVMVVAITK
jgi:hypothetical protein